MHAEWQRSYVGRGEVCPLSAGVKSFVVSVVVCNGCPGNDADSGGQSVLHCSLYSKDRQVREIQL